MNTTNEQVNNHPVVSSERWIAERKKLLARERELTHLRDEIASERRALPWVRVEKNYVFDTPEGKRTLGELFEGRRQLMVQHFLHPCKIRLIIIDQCRYFILAQLPPVLTITFNIQPDIIGHHFQIGLRLACHCQA